MFKMLGLLIILYGYELGILESVGHYLITLMKIQFVKIQLVEFLSPWIGLA